MRLDRLDLTRYGRFTDKRLHFPLPPAGAPDLHVIYGPNEAGKSTLFSAWLDFLYGIPLRTRYDFLHGGPNMRIGAQISHQGGLLDLARIKKNSASLIDERGQAVPETLLQSLLSGLSRDGYGAMFSLDDDTIERGGDSILASKGDLGEMLFSASAGLAGLGPQLDAVRTGLDEFHKIGGRKGALRDAKQHLADLDRKRRELDTSAAAFRRLVSEAQAAEDHWRVARQQEEGLANQLQKLRDAQAALPLRARLANLTALRQGLGPLPRASESDVLHHREVEAARIALVTRLQSRRTRLDALEARLAQTTVDTLILSQRDAMTAADALHAEHLSALKDLPRRRTEAEEAAAETRDLLARLERAEAQPADLALPPTRLSQLRNHLARYATLHSQLQHSKRECEAAERRLDEAKQQCGTLEPDVDAVALSALLAQLRHSDPAGALQRATRELDQCRANLRAALGDLAPWQGEAQDLAQQTIPTPWQLDSWQQQNEVTRQAEADARHASRRAAADLAQAQGEAEARRARKGSGSFSPAQADMIRSEREALWSAHLAQLTLKTAAQFEAKLREDDRISAMQAAVISDAHIDDKLSSDINILDGIYNKSLEEICAAQTARQNHLATVELAANGLGIAGAPLEDLSRWLERRKAALGRRDALLATQDLVVTAQAELARAVRALAALIGWTQKGEAEFAALWAVALARESEAEQRRAARAHLHELSEELTLRQQDLRRDESQLSDWLQDWQQVTVGTVLADRPVDALAMGGTLDLLDLLGRAELRRASLFDRVSKMEANHQAFTDAFAAILAALDAASGLTWPDLQAQLRRAEDDQAKHQELQREIAAEMTAFTNDQTAAAVNAAEIADVGRRFDWQEGQGINLADHLARCVEAERLSNEIRTLQDDLAKLSGSDQQVAGDDLQGEIVAAASDFELARTRSQELFAALSEARRRISAVGGDAAVAQIEAERANLINGLKEDTRKHLAQRFGLLALEQGLRRYRDNHRSAMLSRAASAFSQLSRGAYRDLVAEPSGGSEVLVAIPAEGGSKLAADMSKGTRFQLYLALRIAGYHELAASRPMVPFIADDIMETFDDDRAHEAFSLLAEMARSGQVIYLTHNRHLCEIARAACSQVQILDLQQI
ncbi:AAA family ATPase [Paracoccus sp. (in: a-proteobacteria)]|uniref:AAA family ATPase n=1 Tax=Paracoccus sp. TaxID=267 RepID=UPI0028977F37|nr:AAA family ATPase [Paracoccus sp. (in: a-proteobacteria)]